MVGQTLAHHLRVPGIVILLVLGAVLGPDVANVIQPDALGAGLSTVVGFAVAVILFEGGLSLELRRLRREQRAIRQLITLGAGVSLVAGGGAALIIMGWEWQRSLLFGTLVIVTGPTVVTPLLRRLKVKKSVSTVLEAEGVLIDAVGAITAAVALELVLSPSGQGAAFAGVSIIGRLLFGAVIGAAGGFVIFLFLRVRGVVPEGLENVLTLGFAVLTFETANAVVHESGIAAVTVAGMVVGNMHTHIKRELAEFKEQLTVLLIGMLFVLLVADVRIADVLALGWPGLTIAVLTIVLIRPASVAVGTLRTDLSLRERIFVGWIGPRGIVAAAVASIFGFQLEKAEMDGGTELKALVFLVIAATVGWSALTGGLAAMVLGVKRKAGDGWVVLGGNALARKLAVLLKHEGAEVLAIDNEPDNVTAHQRAGLRAVLGNSLEASTLTKAQLDTRAGAIAATTNEEVNYLFGEKARLEVRTIRYAIALTRWGMGVTPAMIDDFGGELLFGAAIDISSWAQRVERDDCVIEWWAFHGTRKSPAILTGGRDDPPFVPLVHRRKEDVEPVTIDSRFRRHSQVAFLIDRQRVDEARQEIEAAGWKRLEDVNRADRQDGHG